MGKRRRRKSKKKGRRRLTIAANKSYVSECHSPQQSAKQEHDDYHDHHANDRAHDCYFRKVYKEPFEFREFRIKRNTTYCRMYLRNEQDRYRYDNEEKISDSENDDDSYPFHCAPVNTVPVNTVPVDTVRNQHHDNHLSLQSLCTSTDVPLVRNA